MCSGRQAMHGLWVTCGGHVRLRNTSCDLDRKLASREQRTTMVRVTVLYNWFYKCGGWNVSFNSAVLQQKLTDV